MDVSGEPHRGVLTGDDMARWQATVEAPISYDYGRYTVLKAGPWTQGLVTLQQLALLKGFDLDGLDPAGPDFIHLQVECAKLAFADRDTFYGDPAFVDVPVEALLSDGYNDGAPQARRPSVPRSSCGRARSPASASASRRAPRRASALGVGRERSGRADRRAGRLDPRRGPSGAARCRAAGRVHAARRAATPCISTSSTATATWSRRRRRAAGCNPRRSIPELGFCLGTRAQMFWLDEDHPAGLEPGKRPRTTLTPTMALRDGEPYLAWGSPGGDQQDQWVDAVLPAPRPCRHNLQEAIDAPAWHTRAFPVVLLAAHGAARRARRRGPGAEGDGRGAAPPRPHRRGRRGLVGGPPHRRVSRRRAPQGRRQSARHAGLRGRALT